MDLFDHSLEEQMRSQAPLAARMRPQTLNDIVGQDHIIGEGTLLRRAIQADRLFSSIILYGPPGTGKTTIARVIANTTNAHFVSLSAVLAGVADLRKVIQEATDRRKYDRVRTILFIDEIHRWNKAQQDALLPQVESGMITLIGATTQNPYFDVIKALVSRSRIFELKPLTREDIERIYKDEISEICTEAEKKAYDDALAAKEAEILAIRIILTGRLADLAPDIIRERLREAYV